MSITITITIDGGEVSATNVSPQSTTTISPHSTTSSTASEIIDAGSAPSEMTLSQTLGLPSSISEQDVSLLGTEDIAAGAAPSEMELSSGMLDLPTVSMKQPGTTGEAGDIAAGAAPNFPRP